MAPRWLKGNTHTHTRYSDGDSSPEDVVAWYEANDYDFLFLTDHNVLIPDDHLAKLQRGRLRVWQGEEVSMGDVHVNGLDLHQLIMPFGAYESGEEPWTCIQWAVETIKSQNSIDQVNHPNCGWTLSTEDLLRAGPFSLLEIANGGNLDNNDGDATHPSTEVMWDALLASGRQVWGVASDDAHHFINWGENWANPGRGWLQVEAESAAIGDVMDSLRQGQFYASSGLELSHYRASTTEISLELADTLATIELVGPGNATLEKVVGDRVCFKLAEAVGRYVRVRVVAADGRRAWTQPVFR